MKKIGVLIVFFFSLFSCSDSTPKVSPEQKSFVKINMATTGLYNFENYIRTLQLYAFREEAGKFVFYRVLADWDTEDLQQLESASSDGGEHKDTKLFYTELPVGNYRVYGVGNVRPVGSLKAGSSTPEDVYLEYPEGGIHWSYFLGEADVRAGETAIAVTLSLQRIVSRLFVRVNAVPWQIDTVKLSVGNIATKIALNGSLGTDTQELTYVFTVKAQNMYESDTAIFDFYTFPTVGTASELNFIFHSRSGEERIKSTEVYLRPDKYLQLTADINGTPGSLLSFDISFIYFLAWDWRDIELPDFSLKPDE